MFYYRSDYKEEITIPRHNCLKLISNCEQDISALTSRRLLTFEKISNARPLDTHTQCNQKTKSDVVAETVGDFRSKFVYNYFTISIQVNKHFFLDFLHMKKKADKFAEFVKPN